MKTVLYFSDIGSYSTNLSTSVLPYYKIVLKDLVEKKISKNSSSSTRFFYSVL